ncbi:hypothetical protein A2W14_04220 [Candidatus Gottesmanbacteria bacterium RBG_16_37_8]|uniref:Fibronectin type-III domain-containing protein n=1 Tax=Candidatus Gottesmanbacteria bacterium RBG_16_37_8 TaxID=1798371 RepID=A0A1F5YQC5_9BACT|nr:MAG: hypothetical protein A2W14_04220 [Candidatus Gottesmanbacteria bacterium RBG_16_37_8]
MFCPACNNQLQKISVTTKEGGRFEVDHCGYCGGTWFDPYEINRIPFHEVVTLANLTVQTRKIYAKRKVQLCPNDHCPLDPFKGDAVPKDVRLLWCKRCLGIWATQKDLWEFKKHQEETVSAYDVASKFFPALSVAFIPVLTFLFLLATTFTTIFSVQQQKEARIFAESRISHLVTQTIQPDTVSITFITQVPLISSIVYGQSSLEMTEAVISEVSTQTHAVILSNLKENTDYLFRLTLEDNNGKTYTTDLKTFSTR